MYFINLKKVNNIETLQQHLDAFLYTQNRIRHTTTKQVPYEIHFGKIISVPVTVEENDTMIEEMREDAKKNIVKAAEEEKIRWKMNKKVQDYQEGEEVWVCQRDSKKRKDKYKLWERKAIVLKKRGDYLYTLKWGKDGGYNGEKEGEESIRNYTAGDLKPVIKYKKNEEVDAGVEVEAGKEVEADAGVEAGEEVEADAGVEAGEEVEADAGVKANVEMEVEVEADAGVEVEEKAGEEVEAATEAKARIKVKKRIAKRRRKEIIETQAKQNVGLGVDPPEKERTNKSRRGERQETEETREEEEEENTYLPRVSRRREEKVALGGRSLSHFFAGLDVAAVERENRKRKEKAKKAF